MTRLRSPSTDEQWLLGALPPDPTSSDAADLPTYNDVQAAHRARSELRQNFITLTNDQLDIQELFKIVAGELEGTPEIGEDHPIVAEWNELRQVRVGPIQLYGVRRRG